MLGPPSPPVPRDSGLSACSQAETGSGPGWGWHWGQLSFPSSHMPLFGLNFPLPASALFSAQLAKSPLELLFLPLFPNLDGPKAPQADKDKFISSLCLWHCWNTLLPQILHQGSLGKAQCPQDGSTLTYFCPSLLTPAVPLPAPSGLHGGASSCGSPCVTLGNSQCPRLLL